MRESAKRKYSTEQRLQRNQIFKEEIKTFAEHVLVFDVFVPSATVVKKGRQRDSGMM